MATRPAPSQSEVERAFGDALTAAGFTPGPIQADTDHFVRFDAPGDKKGRQNGFYKLRTGTWPVGWFGDWKLGEQTQWSWHQHEGMELSAKDRAAMQREQRKLKAEAQVAREAKQAEVAEDASQMWGRADGNVEGHPYLVAKKIAVAKGLRVHQAKDGTRLLAVPMWSFDMNGKPALTSLQPIGPDGGKRFLTAGRVLGTFFSIKGDSSAIVICEGVATAFKIWETTGLSVVAAFNSGNLIEVAKEFARDRPLATLLIAGDDDVMAPDDWAERGKGKPWVNAGRVKAFAAAKAIGCRVLLPVFADGPARDRTDFDDLFRVEGAQAVAGQIMGALRSVDPEEAEPGARVVDIEAVQDETWRKSVPLTSSGAYDGANVEGVAIFIQNHRLLRDRLTFNSFTKAIELDGKEMEDYHVAEFRRVMHFDRLKAKKPDVADEMIAEARRNTVDPLSTYLGGLKWDNRPRLSNWLTRYLGVAPKPYVEAVGRAFLIGAVARALDPGCKMDTMLVLEGEQGSGKSTALRYLFSDRFFIDNLPDFHSKDSFMQLQGAWCVEVAELSALGKADVKDVKQFLSRLVDKFRPPYGKGTVQVGRRVVFAGTVNPEEGGYLRDPTGARRFWPVTCGNIDLRSILAERDQLWAEAVAAYRDNERWHLEDEMIEAATVEQAARREVDPWEELIRYWAVGRDNVTVGEVMDSALKLTPDKQTPAIRRRVGACFRAIGWIAKTQRVGAGTAKVFVSPLGQAQDYSGGPGPRQGVLVDGMGNPVDD